MTKEKKVKEQPNKKQKKKKPKMKLWKKIVISIASIVLVLSFSFGGFVLYYRIGAKDYYSASEKAFEIPGLNKGFIPQGFDYNDREENGVFLVSGYMKDGSASPLYLVDYDTKEVLKRATFLTDEESEYTGHFGGVAIYKDFVYVADGTSLLVYSYQQIKDPENFEPIPCLGKIELKYSNTDYIKASFVTVYNNTLIVGEFYNGEKYKTLNSHHITTKAGDKNCALAVQFNLNTNYSLGLDKTPTKAYSLPNEVQGFYIYGSGSEKRIYLSTSYGLKFSHILGYKYNGVQKIDEETNTVILGTPIPVYAVDSSALVFDYKIAPMSEEIVIVENELYVMSESASNKYIFGKFIGGKWCYKTNLDLIPKNIKED